MIYKRDYRSETKEVNWEDKMKISKIIWIWIWMLLMRKIWLINFIPPRKMKKKKQIEIKEDYSLKEVRRNL